MNKYAFSLSLSLPLVGCLYWHIIKVVLIRYTPHLCIYIIRVQFSLSERGVLNAKYFSHGTFWLKICASKMLNGKAHHREESWKEASNKDKKKSKKIKRVEYRVERRSWSEFSLFVASLFASTCIRWKTAFLCIYERNSQHTRCAHSYTYCLLCWQNNWYEISSFWLFYWSIFFTPSKCMHAYISIHSLSHSFAYSLAVCAKNLQESTCYFSYQALFHCTFIKCTFFAPSRKKSQLTGCCYG